MGTQRTLEQIQRRLQEAVRDLAKALSFADVCCQLGVSEMYIGCSPQSHCWLPLHGTTPIPVAAGSPWQNSFLDSFDSRCRDVFPKREGFESVPNARSTGNGFRRDCNTVGPHIILAYQTPREFRAECDDGLHGQPNYTECLRSVRWPTVISG